MATVLGMSLIMIAVALGIIYLFDIGLPLPAPVILLVFAIGFTLGSVFFERRGAEHPWSLIGGALASMGITFLVMSIVGGILFVVNDGLSTIPTDTVLYSLSACIIISMVTLNFASYKLQYI
ncbi:MAG: heat-shock protein [Methanosarcinales archaeon]|nr:heat-shock protein [Methanosarcinales archaeon]